MSRTGRIVTIAIVVVVLLVVGAIAVSARLANQGSAVTGSDATTGTGTATGERVAFYGDSYTLGTGASSADRRWSTVICAERGWQEFNPSVNGLGFVNNRDAFGVDEPALIIADQPDIVFITMGLNDAFSYDRAADEIHDAIDADFAQLKSALPDARFIVVEPFWYLDDRPESILTVIDWVKAAAADIDADYIPGASTWIAGHPEWMAADGLHPNDAGYAAMAVRMDAELKKLDL
ncbi:SGNH/GDSL hydrolase family protein [Naasia lichenicola]|uniref:SGNH/GDSL hydrolase family protein n=1 Tax=Naasia lichenicola TaxID=2565933 RepID=A0A4S4FKE9_9MICO|nr:SGNH/GDSL hydrolase family protein [Naasia lichenicola]THG30903.1 SGNH/GDSL hydrolase family protein [Naasia lichenicola]